MRASIAEILQVRIVGVHMASRGYASTSAWTRDEGVGCDDLKLSLRQHNGQS